MKKIFYIWILVVFFGCSDAENIPFEGGGSRFVVEGWVSDLNINHYVRISQSIPFTSSNNNNWISDASVSVYEREGGLVTIHDYQYADEGYYYSINPFDADSGKQYSVRITLEDGATILSNQETMTKVKPIDSLGYDFFLRESETDPDIELEIYYPVARTGDPAEQRNFYRWKLFKNDTLFSRSEEIFLFNDRFINGNQSYNQEFTPYEYLLNDTIRVERMEISQQAYEYLFQLKSQTISLGTNAAVSPASIKSNLSFLESSQVVLGFFGATSISTQETIITK